MDQPSIFISYARIDDELPPDEPEAFGFVDYLRRRLRYEFRQLSGGELQAGSTGGPTAERDCEPIFEKSLKNASLLLIVISPNWTTDTRCLQDLKDFQDKFRPTETDGITETRIVAVGKMPVHTAKLPKPLREVGYRFYQEEREDGTVIPFFVKGKPGPQQYLKALYNQQVKNLAQELWSAAQLRGLDAPPSQARPSRPSQTEPTRLPPPKALLESSRQSSRRVFVAKPAGDMQGSYHTLVQELTGPSRGYEVVPPPDSDMPNDGEAAKKYIESALASAELSIHLLGNRPGFAPDGEAPIVELQLRLAGSLTLALKQLGTSPDAAHVSISATARTAPPAPTRVFLSYSHDSPDHMDQVLALANRLRRDGIDAIIDQYVQSPPQGWPAWCQAEIRKAGFVLMVCTESYFRSLENEEEPGKGRGRLWEGRLIKQYIYDEDSITNKFVPLLLAGGSRAYIPVPVKGASFYQLDTPDGYESLLRLLTAQPLHPMPELGPRKSLPPQQEQAKTLRQTPGGTELLLTQKARLMWAPKVLPDAQNGASVRDPQAVLAKFLPHDNTLQPQDKLVGETLANFIQFVIQHLEAQPPVPEQLRIPVDSIVYLGFDERDLGVAALLGESLKILNIDPEITGIQGDLAQREALRLVQLQKCDAVLLCWSNAEEIWVRSLAYQLDWRKLGRDRPFVCRSVVQLKPPDHIKDFFRSLPPRRYIDTVIDATETPPTPQDIAELLRQQLLARP
jgi:hypothetical protein